MHDPEFPNTDNVFRIFDLKNRKIVLEQGLKFMFGDGTTNGFRYNYHDEILIVVGSEGPNYSVDLKSMKIKDIGKKNIDHIGYKIHSITYVLKDSVFFVWIDDHLFPLSKEIEDGIEQGWAMLK